MGSTLYVWTLSVIFVQTFLSILIGWLTLDCRLVPKNGEFHEITLVKLLYLYEPEQCERIFFYNYTYGFVSVPNTVAYIVWPLKNDVALAFRHKIRVWMCLHIFWMLLAIANLSQNHKSCGFYAAWLPFIVVGCTILLVDIIFTATFIRDAFQTGTEVDILEYISGTMGNVYELQKVIKSISSKKLIDSVATESDTSWIALMMAFFSCRGIVQWIINFWIIIDNYQAGVLFYRYKRNEENSKIRRKTIY